MPRFPSSVWSDWSIIHGMAAVYSTYEAKAKLSEILRQVRQGKTVVISHRGEPVARVCPVEPPKETLDERIARLRVAGVISPPGDPKKGIPMVAHRPGALKRFLASRD